MGKKHLILASIAISLITTGSLAHASRAHCIDKDTRQNRAQLRERDCEPWEDRRDEGRREEYCRHYRAKHKHTHAQQPVEESKKRSKRSIPSQKSEQSTEGESKKQKSRENQ